MTKKSKSKTRKAAQPRSTADTLRQKWEAAVKSLAAAEAEVEKQVRQFVAKSTMGQDARRTFGEFKQRVERERKKAAKELEAGVSRLQGRLKKERHNVGRVVDDAVHRALVAFNIPSRQEVGELTRKVDELSRKIDSFRTGPTRRRAGVRKAARRS
jgi:polyhydroxyalkanoate synthesis regulator phasin